MNHENIGKKVKRVGIKGEFVGKMENKYKGENSTPITKKFLQGR
jgi:hypothetical protein